MNSSIDHTSSPRWVEKRANCNVELKFVDLRHIVKRDVKDINACPEETRRNREFQFSSSEDSPFFAVQRRKDGKTEGTITFERNETVITVRYSPSRNDSPTSYKVTPRFSLEDGKCLLYVGGDCHKHGYETWEISSKFLDRFFFEAEDQLC